MSEGVVMRYRRWNVGEYKRPRTWLSRCAARTAVGSVFTSRAARRRDGRRPPRPDRRVVTAQHFIIGTRFSFLPIFKHTRWADPLTKICSRFAIMSRPHRRTDRRGRVRHDARSRAGIQIHRRPPCKNHSTQRACVPRPWRPACHDPCSRPC